MLLLSILGDDQEDEKVIEEITDEEVTDETEEESSDELKKAKSDYEKGAQKLIKQKKSLELAMDSLTSVHDDPSYLMKLNERDKFATKIILDKYYDGRTIEEFEDEILKSKQSEKKSNDDTTIDKDSIKKQILEEMNQKEIKGFLKEFKKNISHHDEDIQEQIMDEYSDYIEGKREMDSEKAKKYAYRAYQDIIGTKFEETKKIASMMGTGDSKKSGVSKDNHTEARDDFRKVMVSLGKRFN